jgi:hypothetical protein
MKKEELLKSIAINGYNVGFGAKKNFASHDIVLKLPSWIGFITLAIGILQLGYNNLGTNKELSALLIIISVAALYINIYNSSSDKFESEGVRLTKIFNQLRDLYYIVKVDTKSDFESEKKRMDEIMLEFYSNTISKQVFLSQWYAHFKFFYEMQIDWIDEQLKFRFFKDKLPNSLKSLLLVIVVILLTILYYGHFKNI